METNTPAVESASPASETTTATSLLDTAPAGETAAPSTEVTERPEWLPENFWRDGKADYPALAKSYAGMREILGRKSQSVLVPNEKSKPEEIAEFRKALGVPETPEDYLGALKPESMPEGVQFDEALAKQAAQLAHKHNIPPAAMKELAALQMGQVQSMAQASERMVMAQLDADRELLKTEYGDKYGDTLKIAQRVAITSGTDPNTRGFSDPAMVKFAAWVATVISEDKLVSANATPMQAGKERALDVIHNEDNPMHRRYHDGDEDVQRQVRAYFNQR